MVSLFIENSETLPVFFDLDTTAQTSLPLTNEISALILSKYDLALS